MCKGRRAQPTTKGTSNVCMHMQVESTKAVYASSKHTCPYYTSSQLPTIFATKP